MAAERKRGERAPWYGLSTAIPRTVPVGPACTYGVFIVFASWQLVRCEKKMTSPSPLFLDYLEVAVAALELGWLSYYDVYTLYLSTLMCISVLVRYIPLTNR